MTNTCERRSWLQSHYSNAQAKIKTMGKLTTEGEYSSKLLQATTEDIHKIL